MNWWENDFIKVRANRLFLGGSEAAAIACKHGTPLYVYGRNQVLANYDRLYRALAGAASFDIRICYAMKANPHRGILKLLEGKGAWIDAVSPGEAKAAVEAGFPARRILFTGTSVSPDDLRKVFSRSGVTVNIDALEQIELMKEVKDRSFKKKKIRVSVRWNPGIGRGFSPKAVTAGAKSSDGTPVKFGVEERKVQAAFEGAIRNGFLPVGLHQHLGSGWVKEDFEAVRTAVDKMIRLARKIRESGIKLEFLDFGGGFGPKYAKSQSLFPVEDYARYICRAVRKSGLDLKAVALEPGKYLLGDAGVLLLRVEYTKESYGNLFACVSGGTFNTVPRPAIYMQAQHEIINCMRVDGDDKARVTVAGHLCETGDVFGKERLMPRPQRGDILAVLCAGAYCRSMASNFNLREIPKEIIV
jgi:diaminopimelate decarboxylase